MSTLKTIVLVAFMVVTVFVKPMMTASAPYYDRKETTAKQEETKLTLRDLPPILQKIAKCESGGSQFTEEGEVIRGHANPSDLGLFQINWDAHSSTIKRLGLDIFTEEGNIKYALRLYENRGTRDWNASKYCWGEKSTSTINGN